MTQYAWCAQGTLVNETKCLACETVTAREEAFYDLSLDIDQNTSLSACLRNFRCRSQDSHLQVRVSCNCIQ